MTAFLIILLFVILLTQTKIKIKIRYEEERLTVNVQFGLIHLTVFPVKQSKKTKSTPKSEKKIKKETAIQIRELLPLLRANIPVIEKIFLRLREKLVVTQLTLRVICAGDDPGDAALMYGYANAGLALLMPQLERFFTIKKRNIQLSLDYERPKIDVLASVIVSMTVGRCIALCVSSAVQIYGVFKSYKKQKGGVDYESSNQRNDVNDNPKNS